MAVNGRVKGAKFERETAKLLESWWGTKISRTPLSGGWGGNTLFDTAGDLICAGGWPFVWELKCHEGWHLEQLLRNDKSLISKWWQQACRESRGHKKRKMPMLIFTRNRQPEYLMMRKDEYDTLLLSTNLVKGRVDWTPFVNMFELYLEDTQEKVAIMLLQEFLENIGPPRPSPNRKRGPLTRPQHKPKLSKLWGNKR